MADKQSKVIPVGVAVEKDEAGSVGSERTPVTNEELVTSFSGEAVHSNKMLVSVVDGGVRIAFMEQYGDQVPAMFRTAVFLSVQDALALRDLLARQLGGLEESLKEAMRAAAPEEKKEDGE